MEPSVAVRCRYYDRVGQAPSYRPGTKDCSKHSSQLMPEAEGRAPTVRAFRPPFHWLKPACPPSTDQVPLLLEDQGRASSFPKLQWDTSTRPGRSSVQTLVLRGAR